jgi:exodeoxyribonuclease VII large subunit
VSRDRWVYFDLKDAESSVHFFGTIYNLPGPLEDGMMLSVKGMPRLHQQYGFSITIQHIQPVGEGSIKKAAKLLEAKLTAEGLFDPARKRTLPFRPVRIGLVTSAESAAYRDFLKIANARWGGLEIYLVDVQVQGEAAVPQIVQAIGQLNAQTDAEVVVITRGGGSAEDLQAFSTEQVTRAVAASRIPTLVAIGHEVDISLAELAADQRASTPSNAAELLVPDRKALLDGVRSVRGTLEQDIIRALREARKRLQVIRESAKTQAGQSVELARQRLTLQKQIIAAFDPAAALKRGYALVRLGDSYVRSGRRVRVGDELDIRITDARLAAVVRQVTMDGGE